MSGEEEGLFFLLLHKASFSVSTESPRQNNMPKEVN